MVNLKSMFFRGEDQDNDENDNATLSTVPEENLTEIHLDGNHEIEKVNIIYIESWTAAWVEYKLDRLFENKKITESRSVSIRLNERR